MENQIVLQRKQPREFIVNYPYGERGNKEYKFMGTKGNKVYERPVPMEVFEWLSQYTTTFQNGDLIIKPTELEDNEDVKYTREGIDDIEDIETSIFTRDEIVDILEKGNHNSLKKNLKALTDGKSEAIVKNIQKQVTDVASEIGIDSSAKRKIICEWANLDFEISEVIFDKNIEELHK